MIKNIIIIILILALVGVIVFLDVPAVQGILRLKKDIKIQKETLLEKQDFLAKLETLKKDYQENKDIVEKVDYILPSGKDEPNLIVQLEALAIEGGLVLEGFEIIPSQEGIIGKAQGVRVQAESDSKKYKSLTVTLKLVGDYSSLKKFLGEVENNVRLMDVESIDFSPQSGLDFQFFNFDISLKTYYQ